jgi:hypothetical protein
MRAEIERLNRTNEEHQRQRQRELIAALEKASPAPRWTLGMLEHLRQLEIAAEAKRGQGLPYVAARLEALNYLACWTVAARGTLWPPVNRHLWRIAALYAGGDCFLASWPGAEPHQPLWRYRQPRARRCS